MFLLSTTNTKLANCHGGHVVILLSIKTIEERDWYIQQTIEHSLTQHITKFLTELGKGFAFVGRQVPIEVDDEEFFIDLLFYHLKLCCYVVIKLKPTAFKPEHAGQLNFYLTAVDQQIKIREDRPTIGISEYQLTKAIPEKLQVSLPTIQEIEEELKNISDDK